MGLADSIILLAARAGNDRVVTGDEHFRTVKEAVLIKDKAVASRNQETSQN